MIKAWVRRWLALDGKGGLAETLSYKDRQAEQMRGDIDRALHAIARMTPMVNQSTMATLRLSEYEKHVPSIRRWFMTMHEKALRERRRKEAEAALAAPPVVEPHPPIDGVLDDLSAEVGGG